MDDSDLDLTSGDSPFACDKCEQTFNSRQELKEHGRSAHQLL